MARTIQGKTYTWQISDTPIGSGDAGEVYTAVCLDHPDLSGMMKKPTKIATAGTILRQARQIAQESLALAMLDGLPQGKAHPPRLLDQADEYTHGTANYFIISETAPGDDLETMLARSRQEGKPFPHRVIITVLDALFDLFSRAHRAGVLWNDIKLEHIYWHNETSRVAVIDWGNAIFLDPTREDRAHIPPRWEDYRQMVETLGDFLQRTAPTLYVDLGWKEFEADTLDLQRISILARRIAYQQQVVALQVMEYQSLIRVILHDAPSLPGFKKIQTYQRILEEIDAPYEREGILEYGQSLVIAALGENDTQSAIKTVALLWEQYGESLGLSWHLLREYFRLPEILVHKQLVRLSFHTLHANWSRALWSLMTIARDTENPLWWSRLSPVLRQKALGTTSPPPYQVCQLLLGWAKTQGTQKTDLARELAAILNNWHHKGAMPNENPLEYHLLDMLRGHHDFPQKLVSEVKSCFATGEGAVRALLATWSEADWDNIRGALQQVACWDPDRWGLINLSEMIDAFIVWKQALYHGPGNQPQVEGLLEHHLKERPPVEHWLGSPTWITRLTHHLQMICNGASVIDFPSTVKQWCPWLLQYPVSMPAGQSAAQKGEANPEMDFFHFTSLLKNHNFQSKLTELPLTKVAHHPGCAWAIRRFDQVLSLQPEPAPQETPADPLPYPALSETWAVLHTMESWRKHISEGELDAAWQVLKDNPHQDWWLLEHTIKQTKHWSITILPALHWMAAKSSEENPAAAWDGEQHLADIINTHPALLETWSHLYVTGIHSQWLETIESAIESARVKFLNWRKTIEKSNDPVNRLIYHNQLSVISLAAESMVSLVQHSREARLNFAIIGAQGSLDTARHWDAAGELLANLAAIESHLVNNPSLQRFPDWEKAYQAIGDTESAESRRQMVLSMSDNHPLYAWLVETNFTE